jgi:hypothetical protein
MEACFKKIALHKGELQYIKAMEEMSEIQKEICKYMLANNEDKKLEYREKIIEEMGDVLNTFDTLCVLLSIDKKSLKKTRLEKAKKYASKL